MMPRFHHVRHVIPMDLPNPVDPAPLTLQIDPSTLNRKEKKRRENDKTKGKVKDPLQFPSRKGNKRKPWQVVEIREDQITTRIRTATPTAKIKRRVAEEDPNLRLLESGTLFLLRVVFYPIGSWIPKVPFLYYLVGLLRKWVGRNRNGNRISGLGSDRAKASTSKKGTSTKIGGSAIRYEYPSLDLHDSESDILAHKGDNKKDELHPIILLPKESQIVAYMDQTTPSKPALVNYTYGYGSDFVLGDKLHRGLGFDDESEATPSGIKSCSKKMEEQEGACSNLSSSETEADAGHDNNNNNNNNSSKVDAGVAEELIFNELSQKKNAGFLSIGGVKLYTQDMSDAETDEDYDGNSLGDESSGTTDQEEQDGVYESDDSVVSSEDDSDIDEEVAEDYLEGIGGEDSVLDTKWLVGQALNDSDDDSSSNTSFDGTLEKLGGIALQDASRDIACRRINLEINTLEVLKMIGH
ncbi:hypothetical protein Golob_005403 [Gossypium lobatum]|uniref:Uncharacterized protein n=1 Tax=Gossypium lobatum TaxID=34289 RepID=A0A7J8MT32_9ROSI|nr:hypothetical protein [Gossypium lobatum]